MLACRSVLMDHPQREEDGKISCAVNYADNLNRLRFPNVCHHVRVEVPEAILPAEELIVVMTDAGRSAQRLKAVVEFRPETFGGIVIVLGNVDMSFRSFLASGVRTKSRFTWKRVWNGGVLRSSPAVHRRSHLHRSTRHAPPVQRLVPVLP